MLDIFILFTVLMIIFIFDIKYSIKYKRLCDELDIPFPERNAILKRYVNNELLFILVSFILYFTRGFVSLIISMFYRDIGLFLLGFFIGAALVCVLLTYESYITTRNYFRFELLMKQQSNGGGISE